ncbi:hypothetical protein CPB86DRAFT_104505 [Serendipita vermifera]|nr:hypothetical protein CPB86DRAFT_104505 [Serendipita vermifera]
MISASSTRPASPAARSLGAGSATDVTSPVDSGSMGGTASGTLVDAPVYPHTASFDSDQMAVTVSSPHLELTFPNGNDGPIVKVPVFSAKDSISGTISVNPASYPISSSAKIVVALEGALYWSEPRNANPFPTSSSKRRSRDGGSTLTLSSTVERKHVFLYSSLNLPLNDEDSPGLAGGVTSPNGGASTFDTILMNRQQALAAVRRRMSYGRAEASKLLERARRKKSAGTMEEATNILSLAGVGAGNPPTSSPDSGPTVNVADPMITAAPWVMKTFMFHLPLQKKDGSAALLPPSVDLRAEAAEHDKGKTKLAEDVRICYKLVARYESPLLSLSKNLEVPIIFEPGSDPESFYATPQPPIKWRETSLEVATRPADDSPIPFKAMLTLPNPPVFARDSESFFFVAFATTPTNKELASIIASNAKITLTISCTYRFDPRRAAAHSTRSNDVNPGFNAKEEKVWKWQEPPSSPLKRRSTTKKGGPWEGVGSQQTTIKRMTGDSKSGSATPSNLERTSSKEDKDEKPLPVLPPQSPLSDPGGHISTPLPPGGFKDDKEGEKTVILLQTNRTGFPHRPKVKADQNNLPEGLWKGQLNYQWWMIPSLDWAGLSVKYQMEVGVEIDGTVLKTRKEFRIVEPHTVRKEERVPQMKKVELDAFV